VALYDAWRTTSRIDAISISLPETERMTIYSETSLRFIFANSDHEKIQAKVKPVFSEYIDVKEPEKLIDIPGNDQSVLEWKCRPTRRGNLKIDCVHLEISSHLGLWARRKIFKVKSEIRVYPNLTRERRKLSALFLHHGDAGLHLRRMLGQGKEFEKLREYIPGDSLDILSWKATAKKGKPISKVYQQEQTQEVYAIIDISRLSGKMLDAISVLEHYISASLTLALVTEKQKDSFGIIAFDDNVRAFVKAKGGKTHFGTCREAVYALQPTQASPNFNNLFSFIRTNLRKRALLVFLTDIDDPALAESFIANAPLVNRKHICVLNSMKSDTNTPLFQGEKPSSSLEIRNLLAGHIRWAELLEVANALRKMGMNLTTSDFENFTTDIVSEYLNIKRRQLL
jgi:uncharacterized protein (DUF58 family)